MSADWKAEHDRPYNQPSVAGKRDGMAVGHIAVLCIGGVMDARFVEVGIGAMFFRKPSQDSIKLASGYCPDIPIHSYHLIRQANGVPLFVLEGPC